jgi:HNH endonuclease
LLLAKGAGNGEPVPSITDYDSFRLLSTLQSVDEVNLWQPGSRTNFKALQPGELFLFKLHAPRNFIVGGGVFARSDNLPTSLAWEAFGTNNGAASLLETRKRIAYYRGQADDPRQDYTIGCRILTQPFFFLEHQWIPIPASWSRHIQQGRTYDAAEGDGLRLWDAVVEREARQPGAPVTAPRYGDPMLIRPRLGQGAFRVGVTVDYRRCCSVTAERTLPILDAAHIQPYAEGGEHSVTNGLLLRTDIHRLLDLGYSLLAAADALRSGVDSEMTSRTAVTTTLWTGRSFHCPLTRDSTQHARYSNGIRRIGFWVNLRSRVPRRRSRRMQIPSIPSFAAPKESIS